MKIKKLEKLQDLIDQDLSWRKKELIEVKLMIHNNRNPLLTRVGIALLSAHFEGFIKQIANYYLVYVSSQNIELNKLQSNFSSIYFSKNFLESAKSEKISTHGKFIENFLSEYSTQKFQIRYAPEKPIIKTESNPTSKVFKEIVKSIGLDFSPYETKNNYIDADLLSNRHGIVHGEKIYISISDFDSTVTNILQIMECFKEQVIDAAISNTYIKQ